MKASEFMVGDWVFNDEGIPKRVGQVSDCCFDGNSSDLMLENGEEYDVKEVKPIPLTRDFLLKNKFRDIGGWWYDDEGEGGYELSMEHIYDSIWQFAFHTTGISIGDSRMFISYVHELQHLLRLCNVNKEIVL